MLKRLKDMKNNKKGFTMVELIVVIAIILVLAAVLVPNLFKWIDEAAKATCKNDAANALTVVQAEVADDYAESLAKNTKLVTTTVYDVDANGSVKATGVSELKIEAAGTGKAAQYVTDGKGTVTDFAYQNGKHYVTWTVKAGWTDVQ